MWSKFAHRQPPPPPPPPPSAADQFANEVAKPSAPPPPPKPSMPLQNAEDDVADDGAWGCDDEFLVEEEQLFDDVNVDDDEMDNNTNIAATKSDDAAAGEINATPEVDSEDVMNYQDTAKVDHAADGWGMDDDINFLNDSMNHMELSKPAPKTEPDVVVAENATSSLGRAAENFGAALLASIDDQDAGNDDRHGTSGLGGFGGGFVMKGLSRFLEAATAPSPRKEAEEGQQSNDVDEDVINEDGWGDVDALDFKEDLGVDEQATTTVMQGEAVPNLEAAELVDEPPVHTLEDGWGDDVDISFNSPQQPQPQPRDNEDGADSGTGEISDSIRDFVAMTEKKLDSKITKGMWDTPPRNDLRSGAGAVSSSLESSDIKTTIATPGENSVAEEEKDVAPKSLLDFVDNLNAELNEFTSGDATPAIDATAPIQTNSSAYSFDNSKDDSPEPLLPRQGASLPLPRQQSWYLNAMEDGKGGVVYGEESAEPTQSRNLHNFEGQIIPDTSSSDSTSIQRPAVGMPLSELPSSANSLPSSMAASEHGDNNKPHEPFRKSEILCDCLELIMPLPNGNENGASEEPGIGKKTLPDGTVVLVNYEKLLQNEATKRILLQRSVEAYEHTIETLQSRYQASMKTAQEQEIQLSSSQIEISRLNELVLRLQDEKENIFNETQLFEAELAAVANDKEYLQQEVETIHEDLKAKEELHAKNIEHQMNLEKSLQEKDAERASLLEQVEMLQSSLSEVQSERDQLEESIKTAANHAHTKSAVEIESLEQELLAQGYEIERLNEQINSMMMDKSDGTVLHEEHNNLREEYDRLKSDFSALQHEMSETKPRLAQLQDENESLRTMQREYDIQLSELQESAELMGYDSGEVDKLAAEVASLTYELGVKSSECEESVSVVQTLQTKLANAEARLVEYGEKCSVLEEKIRTESELHSLQVEDIKDACCTLESQTADLKMSLDERDSTITSLESQIQSLNAQVSDSASLHEELSYLRKCLDDKSAEYTESMSALQLLQAKCDDAEERLAAYTNVSPIEGDESSELERSLRAENTVLCKQIEDMRGACGVLEGEKACLEMTLREKSHAIQSLEAELQSLNGHLTLSRTESELYSRQVVDLQGACRSLESQTTDLKMSLDERDSTINSLESQIQSLNAQVTDSASLHEELSYLRNCLDDKSAEYTESMSALQLLQTKCDDAGVRASELEQTLRAENTTLHEQIEDMRGACGLLETTLHEKHNAIQGLEAQVQSLNAQLTASSKLRVDLSRMSESLNEKVRECETMATCYEQLKLELLNTQSERDVIISKSEENADDAREQISRLQLQIADLLKDQNATMMNVDEQLTVSLQQNSKLQAQCEEYRIKLDDAEKAIILHSEQMSRVEEELSIALQNVHTVKAQILAEETSKSELLQKSIDITKKEEQSMARRYQELFDKYQSTMDEKAEITQSLESRAIDAEQQVCLLQQECAQLRTNLDCSLKSSADAAQSISNLSEQLQSLKESNAELEDKLFDASFEPPGSDLAEVNASLMQERDQLKEETMVRTERINELTSRVFSITAQNDSYAVEREALLSRIRTLEDEIRSENLEELRDELTSLHTERQQLDLDNEELLVQLGLMQQDKAKTQAGCEIEIDLLRDEVAALQDRCTRLQNDLDESMRNSTMLKDKTHNDESDSLRQTISQTSRENESLRDRINELTDELSGNNDKKNQEIKKLRQELALQMLKLSDKEEEAESAQKAMKYAVDKRELEIFKLNTENRSIEKELMEMSSKSGLDISLGDMTLEEKFDEAGDDELSLHNLLAESFIDSDDYIRSQVVILAQALERSELQRADALERIFAERKLHEDSLRQLGESVKRFYSTVK